MPVEHNYVEDFLQDVKNINPKFTESRSSLKGLFKYLRKTQQVPWTISYASALTFCKSNDSRLIKYEPALKRLISVWGQGGHLPYPTVFKEQKINRVCFRGDDHHPDEIFIIGLVARDGVNSVPEYKGGTFIDNSGTTIKRAGDIRSKTAVCVSTNNEVTGLFPLPKADGPNACAEASAIRPWMYVVYFEKGWNTSETQAVDAIAGWEDPASPAREAPGIGFTLYGQEMVAPVIPTKHIIAAIQIERRFTSKTTGTYRYLSNTLRYNGRYSGPRSFKTAAENFLNHMRNQAWKAFLNPNSGFHASLKQ